MKTIVFDTDCFSTFLYSKAIGTLMLTIRNGHILPQAVVNELMGVESYKKQVQSMIGTRMILEESIPATYGDVLLFSEITSGKKTGILAGDGEAEALMLAKMHSGIIACNNTRDIEYYVKSFSLEHVRTKDLLMACVDNSTMSLNEAEQYWKLMHQETKLPQYTLRELTAMEGYKKIDCS